MSGTDRPKIKTFPLRLDDELHRRAKHLAVDEGISLQEWILRAIRERIENDKCETIEIAGRNK